MSLPCPLRPLGQDLPSAGARGVVLTFAALALAWVALSDELLRWVAPSLHGQRLSHALIDAALVVAGASAMCLCLRRTVRARAEAEARLQHQARRAYLLQVLADNSPDAIFAKDLEGRYLLFNRAAAAIMKVEPEAVLGRDDAALMPAQAADIRSVDHDVMRLNRPVTFEEELDTPQGRRTFLTTKGPLRHDGEVSGVFGIARDVTERVQARQRLEHSEQRYRLAAAGGYVWDWDIERHRADSQSRFWELLGHAPPADGEALACLTEFIHPDDREPWQRAVRAHVVQREPYDVEFRARHRDGHWRWFHTQGQALWNAQGRATYMAGTTFDITQRREAQEALRRARGELSNLLQRLMEQERETTLRLAQALHDRLGQVLGSARLHLDLALSGAAPAERLERVSSMLDDAIGEVRRVLVDLRPPLLQERGLAAALDNEVRRGASSGLEVAVRLDSSAAAAFARWPDAVEHAAFMIAREGLANALRHARAASVLLHLDGDGDWLALTLCDDGHGIADSEQHGRPGHLGLVGMRERAASIGAMLTVERAPQGGTRVHLVWRAEA